MIPLLEFKIDSITNAVWLELRRILTHSCTLPSPAIFLAEK